MSVVALPVARISVGPYWLRPACWAVFLVGKAEPGPDLKIIYTSQQISKVTQPLNKDSESLTTDVQEKSRAVDLKSWQQWQVPCLNQLVSANTS